MFLYIFGAAGIGVLIGMTVERYKWVRRAKNNKVVEVDGDLYEVKKAGPSGGEVH